MVRRICMIIFLCTFCFFFLVGCASLRAGLNAYSACMASDECIAEVNSSTDMLSIVSDRFGVNKTVQGGIGMLISLLGGLIIGRKYKRKV